PARANLEHRRQLLHRLVEHLDWWAAGALAYDRQRVVDDLLGQRLLAVAHHLVDDLLNEPAVMGGVRLDWADGCAGATRHG
ncbi:MAG: hypothetical protein QOG62_2826, partial [Thermoleophilaceae bacterium]|nr:hypothetical protein [Thermoleophilaceae bacterium]